MKKFFLFVAFFTVLIFVVSCGGSSKKDKKTDNPDTEENAADEETADTDSTDTDELTDETGSTDNDSGDKTDSENDADTTHDDADTTPVTDDDADTAEPPVPDEDDDADTADMIPDDDADTANTMPDDEEEDCDDTEPAKKDVYLGVVGYKRELFTNDIGLLDSSTADSYKSFIEYLPNDSLYIQYHELLYYAGYTALGMMRDSLIPPDPEKVFLITMIPSDPDKLSITNNSYNPEHYGSNDEYRNALHDRIINEKIHGKKVEAYTIGWNSSDSEVVENLKKLSSCDDGSENCDDYIFTGSDYDEMYNNFDTISEKIYSSYKVANLDVTVPDGYEDGQHLRFTFDIYSDSHLYIEATYRRTSGRTLENITYHGLVGNTSIATGSPDGDYHHFVFEDLRYDDGKTTFSNIDLNRVMLWKETGSGSWEKEPAFDHSILGSAKHNTMVMLILETSLGFVATSNGQKFVDTLIGGNTDTSAKECSKVNGEWNDLLPECWRTTACPDIPSGTVWNQTQTIMQRWNGSSWQPEAITVYNETPSNEYCRFRCQKTGEVWDGSECVTETICYPNNPCDSIDNSTGVCTEQKIYDEYFGYMETVYICGCKQGYLWNEDDLQCRQIPTTFSECNTADTTLLSFPCKDSTDYVWSELYKETTWQQAKNYCSNLNSLNYGGFSSGWHLPTIDELRTLIKNCDDTKPGGICRVTENCLSPYCWDLDDCSCTSLAFPKYSKFGDKGMLWSSSAVSNYSADDLAWFVNFSGASVSNGALMVIARAAEGA